MASEAVFAKILQDSGKFPVKDAVIKGAGSIRFIEDFEDCIADLGISP